MEASCQVLMQLLPPEAASRHTVNQRLASVSTIAAATLLLASNNIKVCIRVDATKRAGFKSPDVLYTLAPVIQQFDYFVDASASHRGLRECHIRALLLGVDSITSMSFYLGAERHSCLRLLADFGKLQHLELQLDNTDGLGHLSGLKGLLELHLTIPDTRQPDSSCSDILESNQDTLMHVSLSAGVWDDRTYLALLCLGLLRTFSLAVCTLQKDAAEVLAQLRPSQSMSVTVHKVAHHVVAESVLTMQNLTSLTLAGLDLTSTALQPQPSLQVLSLCSVFMRSTQLEEIVQNCPSLRQLKLHKVHGLLISPDTLCTILRFRHLTTLCLSDLEGLTAARICWLEAFFRAQQSVGMAQPKIHVTCTMADQTIELCVDHTRYPVLCGAEFDERVATHIQRSWAKVAYPSAGVVGNSFSSIASTLQGASVDVQGIPGRVKSYARGLAGSRTWEQAESMHPLGFLVALAILGINIGCLSSKPAPQKCSDVPPVTVRSISLDPVSYMLVSEGNMVDTVIYTPVT